ncbi:RNA polymerase sigma-70 factor [Pedobacter miscanthi]|uniref:RNA polymerase sigma-70 factor n=1 Tax=Pedobacter miscanthi TaxID=2259170 RepID=A0A366KLE5_9SPHI|nr:RNA polymerase sigma-70 factor [Pedobacter miscanthi]RBQ02308.1 RNA polymerase sigma-70 factor [Pedobacter miscanthi]
MHLSHQSDPDLWLSVRNNDGKAFNVLFDRYWLKLYKVALQQLKDEDASLEIVHNVFVSLWTRRKKLEINSIQNFLFISIKYQVYKSLRPGKLSIVYKADVSEDSFSTTVNLGDLKIQDSELQQKLNNSLSELPGRCHQIFRLSRLEHFSNKEIAERLGISQKSVENQLTIALKHLRHAFKDIAFLMFIIHRL